MCSTQSVQCSLRACSRSKNTWRAALWQAQTAFKEDRCHRSAHRRLYACCLQFLQQCKRGRPKPVLEPKAPHSQHIQLDGQCSSAGLSSATRALAHWTLASAHLAREFTANAALKHARAAACVGSGTPKRRSTAFWAAAVRRIVLCVQNDT